MAWKQAQYTGRAGLNEALRLSSARSAAARPVHVGLRRGRRPPVARGSDADRTRPEAIPTPIEFLVGTAVPVGSRQWSVGFHSRARRSAPAISSRLMVASSSVRSSPAWAYPRPTARRYHRAASVASCETPRPLEYAIPRFPAISEFPKGRKYLISLSFRGKASVRPAQVGGFDVNIVIHGSTAVRGRGDLVAYRWALWKLTAPWTHRTRPPHLGKRCAFSTSSTGPFPSNHSRKTPKGPKIALGNPDRPRFPWAPACPWSAARRNHSTAAVTSWGTPKPLA